jgi:NhaA family Na+:H+ antiporter
MVVPAGIYALLNAGGAGAGGWGIPMATDIAFALGVLALMGPRVPLALKVFLAALAIVDDIGAVLVIAVFYTERISWGALAVGLAILGVAVAANRTGARRPPVYLALGVAVWSFFLLSGVHATVAGVLMAMAIPARTRIDTAEFLVRGRRLMDEFDAAGEEGPDVLTNRRQQQAIHEMEQACEHAQAPLQRIEHGLHHWVAFGIIPVFALANAGVHLPRDLGAALREPVTLGVLLGLLLGKPVGITLFSWLAVRLRLAVLPGGVSWGAIHAVSWLGGIGFTMSLFVTGLAFSDAAAIDRSKVGIFAASILAGIAGWMLLRRIPAAPAEDEAPGPLEEGEIAAAHAGA